MIRKLISVALLAGLAACGATGTQRTGGTSASADASTSAPAAQSGATGGTARQVCDAQRIQNMVGQPYSDSVGQSARSGSGSRNVRVLKPGEVMTMEYDESRLNIILNGSGAIDALRCG